MEKRPGDKLREWLRPAKWHIYCAIALIAVVCFMRSCQVGKQAKASTERIQEAIVKATVATEIAKTSTEKAKTTDTQAVKTRPAVQAAKEAVRVATEERINAKVRIESLPMPVQREIHELLDFVVTLETQVWLEVMRGDAWKDSSEAWQKAAEANKELADVVQSEVEIVKKAAWWRGVKIGSITGIAAIILILILL